MPIKRLQISGVRNLQPLSLTPALGVNFIYGENGSGKSSLLEALHILATGKSFRHHLLKPVIQHDTENCVLFSEIEDNRLGTARLGVRRSRNGDKAIKLNGESLQSQAEASTWLPVQIIEPNTFKLLSGSPQERRQFIDWGVFHVEHSFLGQWREFKKLLQQRNAVLKKQQADWLDVWDKGFVKAANSVNESRKAYIERLLPVFQHTLSRLDANLDVQLSFYPGWERKSDLIDILQKQRERDLQIGHTQSGPQRAELRIKVDSMNASDVLSRGQQKVVVAALKLSQGLLFQQETERSTIYLVDDLASELDEKHRYAFCQLLEDLNCQVFITSIDHSSISDQWKPKGCKMFHVEQGHVSDKTPPTT
jgi:DNA replication and repair protein RecF